MKSYDLTKIILNEQSKILPNKIEIYDFLLGNAFKNKNERQLRDMSTKISRYYLDQFWNMPELDKNIY